MENTASVSDRIATLVREAEQEAYARGWQDAIRSIVTAATDAAPAPMPVYIGGTNALATVPVHRVVASTPLSTETRNHFDQFYKKRAPWGTSTKAANFALDQAGEAGVDLSMILAIAEKMGTPIVGSSARSILNDMVERHEVIRGMDGRWRRMAKPEMLVSDHRNGGIAEQDHPAATDQFDNQGGSDETALAH